MESTLKSRVGSRRSTTIALLTAVAVVRAAFAFIVWTAQGSSGFLSPDSPGYISLAQSLLRGRFGDAAPEVFRTPGYPLFLIPAVALGYPVLIGTLENFGLSIACGWLIWRIAVKYVGDTRAATAAVLLFALEPISVWLCSQLWTDLLFTLLILLFLWALVGYLETRKLSTLVASAAVLGAATYVRPVSLYLALWLMPILLLLTRISSWRRRFAIAVLFPVLCGVSLSPWILRNTRSADYQGFSSVGDNGLYFYAAPAVLTKVEPKTFEQIQSDFGWEHYPQVHPEQAGWTPGQIARYWHAEALRVIGAHKLVYLTIHARGCAVVLFDSGGTVMATAIGLYPESGGLLGRIQDQGIAGGFLWLFRNYPGVAAFFLLLEIGLLLTYLLAILGLPRLRFDVAALFVWITIYFVAVSGFPGAVARYREPLMPLLCVAAGAGIIRFAERFLKRKHREVDGTSAARFS